MFTMFTEGIKREVESFIDNQRSGPLLVSGENACGYVCFLPFRSLSLNCVMGNIMASASWVDKTAWQELNYKGEREREREREYDVISCQVNSAVASSKRDQTAADGALVCFSSLSPHR